MGALNFTIFHVGGRGGIGDASKIVEGQKEVDNENEVYIFEADLSDQPTDYREDKFVKHMKKKHGVKVEILPFCISDHEGVDEFYINRNRKSSSMFKISPKAHSYSFYPGWYWRDNCKVDETVQVHVVTLDEVYKRYLSIKPDVLSMDAQGSELAILKGSETFLKDDLLGIFTEVEFREIYENQPLFSDQDMLLRKNDFIFVDLLTTQKWFLGPQMGNSFLTVGEAVYLRDYMYLVNKYRDDINTLMPLMMKLAWVSQAIGYPSYSYLIIDYMLKGWPIDCDAYKNDNKDLLTKKLFKLYRKGRNLMEGK